MSNNSLVRTSLEKTLSLGSLKDLVRVKDTENVKLLLDCSGSMDWQMIKGGRKIDGLRKVVADVQAQRSTGMIAFGPAFIDGMAMDESRSAIAPPENCVAFVHEVPEPAGGTPLKQAIEFSKVNGVGRLLLVSDGCPADPDGCMNAAREFGGRIDVVYIGDPGDRGSVFLEDLAKLTGGQRFEGDISELKEITGAVIALLTGDVLSDDDDDEDEDEDDDDVE